MVFGTVMSVRKSALTLPLPLQFLAALLAAWLGRVLQEQVEYLKAENLLLGRPSRSCRERQVQNQAAPYLIPEPNVAFQTSQV